MLKSSLLVSLLSLLGSIVSFVSQVIIAKLYGTSTIMDNFIIINSMPQMLSGILVASLSYSLVPILLEAKLNQTNESNRNLLSSIIIIGAVTCSLGLLLEGLILHFFHGLDIFHTKVLALGILVWIAAYLGIIIAYFNCYHNSNNSFLKPVLASMFPPFLTIILCELMGMQLGILTLGLGLLLGNICALFFITHNYKLQINFHIEKIISDKTVRIFYLNLPFIVLSMLSFSVFQFIDSIWAPKIGASALSYLSYCQRLIVSIGTLVIIGPSTILIPHITEKYLNDKIDELLEDIVNVLKVIFLLGSYVTIIWLFFGRNIISIFFQRGAFDSASTEGVASIIPFMSLGMVFMLFVVILMRVLYVMKEYKKGSIIGVSSLFIYFLLSGILSPLFGAKGISFAYIVTWLLLTIISVKFILNGKSLSFFSKKSFISSAVIFSILCILFALNILRGDLVLFPLLFIVISFIYFLLIYSDEFFSIYLQRFKRKLFA